MKKIFYVFIVFSCLLSGFKLKAQLLHAGDAVVTMSGNVWSNNTPAPAQDYVLEIFHTKNTSMAPTGVGWQMTPAFYGTYSYKHADWIRSKMGNIFGIAIDNNKNIYATATGFYGTQVAGISTGQVWKIDATTGAVTAFKDLHASGQNQACLGNIKFFNGFLYVSNLADGKIYAIDVSNPAANFPAFDPGGSADLRKPHGLAIRNVGGNARLYFSLNEFNSTTTVIHSIGISGSTFIGAELPELSGFSINSNPVTDLAFSKDYSRLLIAERTTGSWNSSGAHSSRVLEYNYTGSSWVAPNYVLGISAGTNCAGGVSFSQIALFTDNVAKCDTTIWATSDYLITTPGPFYGMTGFRHTTGAGSPNGIIIDFDDNWISWDKTFLGDVEVCDTTIDCTNCACGEWGNGIRRPLGTGIPLILTIPQPGGYARGYLMNCGSSYSFIKGQVSGSLDANYTCAGDCNKVISWQLVNTITNAPVSNGTMNNGPLSLSQFNNLACGSYKIIFTPKCGDKTCNTCEFFITIVCDPPSCCPDRTQVTIEPKDANYNSSASANAWGTYSQSFTINSNVPMGEIRVDVEHFEINSSDPDCISCKNMPKTWGSLLGAAYNGNGFVKPINSLPFSTSAYGNGRELDYKPGTLITINNGVLNVNIGMPNASPIDCCVLTANICLKFTFKDANCKECTYLYCNQNIEIKKPANGNPNGNKLNNVNKSVQKSIF